MPFTSAYMSLKYSSLTVISFFVSVPVLSESITVVAPRVSTDESCFIIAFLRARVWTPRARAIVIVAGRPSGTAATATDTVKSRFSMKGLSCRKYPVRKSVVERMPVIIRIPMPIRLSSFWRGDGSCFVVAVRWAIFPNSVFSPVANTIARAVP